MINSLSHTARIMVNKKNRLWLMFEVCIVVDTSNLFLNAVRENKAILFLQRLKIVLLKPATRDSSEFNPNTCYNRCFDLLTQA